LIKLIGSPVLGLDYRLTRSGKVNCPQTFYAMPTRAGRSALLTLVVTAGQVAVPAHAAGNHGNVLSIGDGDTLRLRSTAGVITVRLACIDAPESSHGPWGAAAGRELQALLPMGKAVELKAKATDRYGRNVAEVFSGGRNIN
jgi:endonuclease YncB( thermonuclease family)